MSHLIHRKIGKRQRLVLMNKYTKEVTVWHWNSVWNVYNESKNYTQLTKSYYQECDILVKGKK